jgi:hypothetical protein
METEKPSRDEGPDPVGSGRSEAVVTGPAVESGGGSGYPFGVSASSQVEYARLLPLVKWLLLVPHYVVLFFLGIAAGVVIFIAFFATLFTGTYPKGLWNYLIGFQRWTLRVTAYLFLMTDRYPPFTLAETAEDPVKLNAVHPEAVERWRPLVAWLLIIPYAIIASLLFALVQICAVLAFFTVIFTRRIPQDIFDLMRIGLNWQVRANLYGYWLSTEYPPFVWDDEGS